MYFYNLKYDALFKRWCCESAALNMPANLENTTVATGLEKVCFHSNPKENQCQYLNIPIKWSMIG